MSTPEPHTQTITRCAAGRGWLWWVEAFRMIKEAPGQWYRIGLGYMAIMIALYLLLIVMAMVSVWVEVVGVFLLYAIMPCFIVGFVAAGWTQARGGTPKVSHLFSGFKADVKTLMGVGVATAALFGLCILVFFVMLGSDFATEMKSLDTEDPMATLAFFTSSRLWLAILVLLLLASLVWMAVWLAPMVVVFQRTGVVKALRSSLTGLLINWRALSVWLLIPLVGSFAVAMVLGVVMTVLTLITLTLGLGGESGAMIFPFLMLGLELLIMPFVMSLGILTSFVAYCDIFHAKDAVFPRPAKKAAP